MINKLLEFLKWCNILRKHFIGILHHSKIQEVSLSFIVPYSPWVLLLLVPSFGEGQYRSLSREKQFATRRILHWFTVGCGWPKSFSYHKASDTHHVKFTYKNDPPEAWNLSQKSLTGRSVRHIGRTVQSLYFLSWTTVITGPMLPIHQWSLVAFISGIFYKKFSRYLNPDNSHITQQPIH